MVQQGSGIKGPLLSCSSQLLTSSLLSSCTPVPPTVAHLLPLANTEPPSLLLQYHLMSDAAGAQMAARGSPTGLCSAAGQAMLP